jgi:hypothetical protein
MKKLALYLHIATFAFLAFFLIFFLSFDSLGRIFGMDPLLPESLVKIFLTGLILYGASWGASALQSNVLNEQIKKMQIEMNQLKAKIYDFEHPKTPQSPKSVQTKPQEESGGTIRPRQNFTKE